MRKKNMFCQVLTTSSDSNTPIPSKYFTAPSETMVLYGDLQIWQCVKTLYPCSSHQNSWDLWMFIPLKMVLYNRHNRY